MSENFEKIYEQMCEGVDSVLTSSTSSLDNLVDILGEDIIEEEERFFLDMIYEDIDISEFTDDELEQLDEASKTTGKRRKIGRILHRGASNKKAQRTKARNARKTLTSDQIMKKARKWAIEQMKKKVTGKLPSESSIADKKRAEKRIESPQFKQKIERLTKLRFRELRKVRGHGEALVAKDNAKKANDKAKSDPNNDKTSDTNTDNSKIVSAFKSVVKDFGKEMK